MNVTAAAIDETIRFIVVTTFPQPNVHNPLLRPFALAPEKHPLLPNLDSA